MGINEFYKNTLGKSLKINTAWGAILPNNTIALNVWSEKIQDGRVTIIQDRPRYTKAGHINQSWTERKSHFKLIQSGVPAVAILISKGNKSEQGAWHIRDFNEDSIFALTDLRAEPDNEWSMKIDLTTPIAVSEVEFDKQLAIKSVFNHFPLAYETINKANNLFGWEIIGLNKTIATLTMQDKLMSVNLASGQYSIEKI